MNFCNNPKFQLGKTVSTPGALDVLSKANISAVSLLAKHQSGDFGDLEAEDKELNEQAIKYEGDPEKQQRVFSSYKIGHETIYIITEWDRSVTTLLRSCEY